MPNRPVRIVNDELVRGAEEPLVTFRTLNGYTFWPEPMPLDDQLTEIRRIRRMFTVRAPGGERQSCVVEITTRVQELIFAEIGREFPAEDERWALVCKGALASYLWQRATRPPKVLLVDELDPEQMETIRRLV